MPRDAEQAARDAYVRFRETQAQVREAPVWSGIDPGFIRPARPAYPARGNPKPKKSKEVFYNRKLIDWNAHQLQATDGEIGIEIECEGRNLCTNFPQFWTVVQDGSLRAVDGHQPWEYYLRRPVKRDEYIPALEYFHEKQAGATVVMSHRTSVHIHVNCQQLTMKQIMTFIVLYMLLENALTQFAGEEREGNLFCQRAKDAEHWVFTLCEALRTGHFGAVFRDDFRYTACNTASLGHLGSLEFRALRGTTDITLIKNWIDLLLHLKDESLNFTSPLDVLERYCTLGANDFYRMVFSTRPDLESLLNTACNTIEDVMREGFLYARDIAMAIPEWKVQEDKEESPLDESPEGQEIDEFLNQLEPEGDEDED